MWEMVFLATDITRMPDPTIRTVRKLYPFSRMAWRTSLSRAFSTISRRTFTTPNRKSTDRLIGAVFSRYAARMIRVIPSPMDLVAIQQTFQVVFVRWDSYIPLNRRRRYHRGKAK